MFFLLALFLKKCASLWYRRPVFPWPGNSAPVFPDRTAGLSSDRLPASSAQQQQQRRLAGADTFTYHNHSRITLSFEMLLMLRISMKRSE